MEGRQVGVFLEQKSDNSGDVGTRKAVACETSVTAARPGGTNVHARSSQLNDFTKMKTEFHRIRHFTFYH